MSFTIQLHLVGYTNNNIVKCLYDKSPLEFYSRIKDDNVMQNQINILKMAWPNINQEEFMRHVCSSSLEKRAWINKLELIEDHKIQLKLSPISGENIEEVIKRSTLKRFENIDNFVVYLQSLKYPNVEIDWMFLILKHCKPHRLGLKNNTLYFVENPPTIKKCNHLQ